MSDAFTAIRRLTRELQELRTMLDTTDVDLFAHAALTDFEMLDDFKTLLDHVRQAIWPHLLAAEQHAPLDSAYSPRVYKIQRIREMLQSLLEERPVRGHDLQLDLFLNELSRLITAGK